MTVTRQASVPLKSETSLSKLYEHGLECSSIPLPGMSSPSSFTPLQPTEKVQALLNQP